MTTYDEKILQQYADSLYQRAQWIVLWTAVIYGLSAFAIAVVLAFAGDSLVKEVSLDAWQSLVIIVTVLGVVAGIVMGREKAFSLKLQAQQILCQRQIEINTRQ